MRIRLTDRPTLVTPRLPPLKRAARLRATIEGLPADQAASFFFLAAQGHRFTETIGNLASKTNCSKQRFTMLAEQLATKGLITMHSLGGELVWNIPQYPSDWTQPKLGEKKFKIPGPPNGGGRPKRKKAP
jgi:hypothetical protein